MTSKWRLRRVISSIRSKSKCLFARKLHFRSKLASLKRIIIAWEISRRKVPPRLRCILLSWLLWRKRRNKFESFRMPMENWGFVCKCWKEVLRMLNSQRKKIERNLSKKSTSFKTYWSNSLLSLKVEFVSWKVSFKAQEKKLMTWEENWEDRKNKFRCWKKRNSTRKILRALEGLGNRRSSTFMKIQEINLVKR